MSSKIPYETLHSLIIIRRPQTIIGAYACFILLLDINYIYEEALCDPVTYNI